MSGFSAVLGNPPFLGGTKISSSYGSELLEFLKNNYDGPGNRCDLAGYFVQKFYQITSENQFCSMIGPDSLAEGDTRRGGLLVNIKQNGKITDAIKRVPWQGDAAVMVSLVTFCKGQYSHQITLDGKVVSSISAMLREGVIHDSPEPLDENAGMYSEGFKPYAQGFIFDDNDEKANPHFEKSAIIRSHPESKEIIKKYISGRELNNNPDFNSEREIIDFEEMTLQEANKYPQLFQIVQSKVEPERATKSLAVQKAPYWLFYSNRPSIRQYMRAADQFLVNSNVTKHLNFVFLNQDFIPSHALQVHFRSNFWEFGILQSYVHEAWVRFFCSTMKGDLRYSTKDGLLTFPFAERSDNLDDTAKSLYEYRSEVLLSREIGLTELYNMFHDSENTKQEIVKLRELHNKLDNAVLLAYGWNDIRIQREFITTEYGLRYEPNINIKNKIIARLFVLNQHKSGK